MSEGQNKDMLHVAVVPVTPFQQNACVIWDASTMKGAITDPGGDIDRLLDVAEKQGVEVEKLLITHGHIDHAGATLELSQKLGVEIEGPHREDEFWLEKLSEQGDRFGFAGAQSFTPHRWLDDGDTVTVGDLVLDVIHCPGHTPGHVVFHHAPSKLAIVGDVLFKGSIGRTDFPRGDHNALISSIREKLWPLGNDTHFVPGHGEISNFGNERQTNPFVADMVQY